MNSDKDKIWAILTEPAGMQPLIVDGDLMSLDEWMDNVRVGAFIDYDGYGNYATSEKYYPDIDVYPSHVRKPGFIFPKWATHIVWYNR